MVTPNGYRGGTRKGLDITLGRAPPAVASKFFPSSSAPSATKSSEGSDIVRGGALLRSVRRVSDQRVISGPSLLVDEVLRLSGAKEIAELVTVHWNSDISAFPPSSAPSPSSVLDTTAQLRKLPRSTTGLLREPLSTMYLVRAPPPARAAAEPKFKEALVDGRPRIFRSPRIGLDLSHSSIPSASSASSPESLPAALAHPRVTFIARPYRFFVSPYLLTYNGRGQSFVGVYDALVARGHCANDRELLGELVRLTGIKGPTATKYLMELRLGLEEGELGDFTGAKGKTVSSSVTGWLRMIGTLRRLGAGEQKEREEEAEEADAEPGSA